jgi:hypothetical protein
MLTSYQKSVQNLLNQDSCPGASAEELELFKSHFRTSAFTCRLRQCPRATIGFENDQIRREHEITHAGGFRCTIPGCQYPPYRSAQSLKSHVDRHHSKTPARKSIRRVERVKSLNQSRIVANFKTHKSMVRQLSIDSDNVNSTNLEQGQEQPVVLPSDNINSAQTDRSPQNNQQRLSAAIQILRQNPGITNATDDRLYPQNVLNNQVRANVPLGVKSWRQLKLWASQNPALLPGVSMDKLVLLQVLHYQDLLKQQNSGLPSQQPPQQTAIPNLTPPAQMTPQQQPNMQNIPPIQATPQEIQALRQNVQARGQLANLSDDFLRNLIVNQKRAQQQKMQGQQTEKYDQQEQQLNTPRNMAHFLQQQQREMQSQQQDGPHQVAAMVQAQAAQQQAQQHYLMQQQQAQAQATTMQQSHSQQSNHSHNAIQRPLSSQPQQGPLRLPSAMSHRGRQQQQDANTNPMQPQEQNRMLDQMEPYQRLLNQKFDLNAIATQQIEAMRVQDIVATGLLPQQQQQQQRLQVLPELQSKSYRSGMYTVYPHPLGNADAMEPPEINIDFAPPSRPTSSEPPEPEHQAHVLSPPDRCK